MWSSGQGHFSTVKNLDPGRSSVYSAYGSDPPLEARPELTIINYDYAASCSGSVHVTKTSLNLSISVSSCDLGTFSINMIPSRWCCPRKYLDNLYNIKYRAISVPVWVV